MPEGVVRETARSYDRIVASYEAQVQQPAPERTAFRDRFVDGLPHRATVVDAGCGPGHDVAHFSGCGLRVLGVDRSSGMARRVHERGEAVVVGDLRRPPVRLRSLDGLWSSASLLHVPREQVRPTLIAWHRLLRPGGVLALSTSLGADEGWEAVPYAPAAGHGDVELRRWFVHHTREHLLRLLDDAGFVVRSVDERVSHRHWLQVLATAGATQVP